MVRSDSKGLDFGDGISEPCPVATLVRALPRSRAVFRRRTDVPARRGLARATGMAELFSRRPAALPLAAFRRVHVPGAPAKRDTGGP